MARRSNSTESFNATRRHLLATGLGVGASTVGASALAHAASRKRPTRRTAIDQYAWLDLPRDPQRDVTAQLQAAIDVSANNGTPVFLPPGRFSISSLTLRPSTRLLGTAGCTTLVYAGGLSFITARNCDHVLIRDITFDGNGRALDAHQARALLDFADCENVSIEDCQIHGSRLDGIAFNRCSGRVDRCSIDAIRNAGLFGLDSRGLDLTDNSITQCGDNGILVWQSRAAPDASRISGNRISNIKSQSGGSGQNGNGINVFRAGNVSVLGNTIHNCVYSAVRGNAASNLQILNNSCTEIGEVALYAEFGFEGAIIANNLVTDAASGIAVTNFNEGGRLATVTGNLIRTLRRREFEPVDKRGIGISAEADTVISQNVIEDAASVGIGLGWGPYRRNLIASQNIVRKAAIGILISQHEKAGTTLVSHNVISESPLGAIRMGRHDVPFGPDLAVQDHTEPSLTVSQNVSGTSA